MPSKLSITAYLFWIAGIWLLSRAIKYWQDDAREEGYNKAYAEIQQIQRVKDDKALARRLAEQVAGDQT